MPSTVDRFESSMAGSQGDVRHKAAAEWINSHLDVSFDFGCYYLRGLARRRVRVAIALHGAGHALGQVKNSKPDPIRSLWAL